MHKGAFIRRTPVSWACEIVKRAFHVVIQRFRTSLSLRLSWATVGYYCNFHHTLSHYLLASGLTANSIGSWAKSIGCNLWRTWLRLVGHLGSNESIYDDFRGDTCQTGSILEIFVAHARLKQICRNVLYNILSKIRYLRSVCQTFHREKPVHDFYYFLHFSFKFLDSLFNYPRPFTWPD